MFLSKIVLTLRELRATTSLAETNFLTFNFTRITGNETSFTHCWTQSFVIFHQCTSNTVTDSTGLAAVTTAFNGNAEVKTIGHFNQMKRLTNYHARSLTTKILI